MPFISDAQLKIAVTAMLQTQEARLDTNWDEIVAGSNSAAYQEIVSKLAERGFSKAQIDAWPRGAEFQRHIGLFWSLTNGAGLHGYDDKFINKFDRRAELETVPITDANGVLVEPEGGGDTVGFGIMSTQRERVGLGDQDPRL